MSAPPNHQFLWTFQPDGSSREAGPVDRPFDPLTDRWIEAPIFDRFAYIAQRHEDSIAIDDGHVQLTYAALRRAAHQLACRIDASVPQGAPLGILASNSALMPVALLATVAVGRPLVPMDRRHPAFHNHQILAQAGARALLVEGEGDAPTGLPQTLEKIDIASSLVERQHDADLPPVAALSPALILYTSGSMGQPKGICHDHRSILFNVAQYTNSSHLNSDDRIALFGSAGTIVGLSITLAALLNGARLCIADPRRMGLSEVLGILREQRITYAYFVPTLLRELISADRSGASFRNFRAVRLGGESVRANDIALLRRVLLPTCHIQITYGSTETGTIFQWFVPSDFKPDGARMPSGYPVANQTIWFDQTDEDPSLPGELVVKGRYLAQGLWQDGCLQEGPFRQDPADSSSRIFSTGDLVHVRDDGLCEIVGRKDRQVKIRGLRVNPAEVEDALSHLAGVAEAIVIARRNETGTPALVAFVVPSQCPEPLFVQDLRAELVRILPDHKRPTHLRIIDKIPLLPNYKPDFVALERLFDETADQSNEHQNPGSPHRVKDALSRAWTEILKRKDFDIDERWYETGGDSLNKLQIWLRVEEALGLRLTFEPFDDDATPKDILAVIERKLARASISKGARQAAPASNHPRPKSPPPP